MHAIILAAGQGKRLAGFNPDGLPKCLLEVGGRSLLDRQLETLFHEGIQQVTLVTGYKAGLIVEHVGALETRPEAAFVYNPAFERGSTLSLLAAHNALTCGEDVLVLDADVLFHPRIMQALIESPHGNCFLLDRGFEPGDEPVKIAISEGRMTEFRKALPDSLEYDTLGESVGFFKFSPGVAAAIAGVCAEYEAEGLLGAPHEEVLRDVLLAAPAQFACEDITGLPWVEIDFPEDIQRAEGQVLPAIRREINGF